MPLSFDLNAVDGLDDLLAEAAGMLEKKLGSEEADKKFRQIAKPLTEDAKAKIHSITGHLAGGVRCYIDTSPDAPTEIVVGVSYKRTSAFHAHLVEGGHGYNTAKPHPFWKPAMEMHLEETINAVLAEAMDYMEDALK